MRARVPNFVKSKVKENKGPPPVINRYSIASSISNGHLASAYPSQQNPVMWHARSYDSGMGKFLMDCTVVVTGATEEIWIIFLRLPQREKE